MSQAVTVLQSLGPLLAKQWNADGSIAGYNMARQFHVQSAPVGDIHALHLLLQRLAANPKACIIRGQPRKPPAPNETVLRRLDVFDDQPSHLFMVDVDNWAGTLDEFVDTLPQCFQMTSYILQLSGSMGHPTRPGLRAHLWFWLNKPLTCAEAEAWAKKYMASADHTVHRTEQINYTANPVMAAGVTDPISERMTFEQGIMDDVVDIPDDMPVPVEAQLVRTDRGQRKNLVDPTTKTGLIGAFCRAYTPYDLCTLFPETFEEGRIPDRITWLAGGGSKEGVVITDTGTHLFNSHATAPVQHAVNLFDFIRTHVFGHHDAGIYPDVLDLDPTAAPSYREMMNWAMTQPKVQQEATGPQAEAAVELAADRKAEAALAAQPHAEHCMEELLKLVNEATSLGQLEHDLGRRIAKAKNFTDAERDVVAQAMKRRAALLHQGGVQISTIRKWLRPTELRSTFPDVGAFGMLKATKGNLATLCAQLGITLRYNVIAKTHEILVPGLETTQDNRETATLAHLISECARVGVPHGAALVKSYVCALADQNLYNPVMTWIESRAWDGVDRLKAFYDTVVEKPGFSKVVKETILWRWVVQAVAAAASPVPLQLRGVLTIPGDQNIGKGRWVMSLAPMGLVRTGHTLRTDNKDSIKTAISYWITELGELDATFRKSDIAQLKAFISLENDTFRLPYAYADSSFQRRTVFYASVNEEEFLADTTGNTRFWVIPVQAMNYEHDIDMQQLWAQVYDVWKKGEPHWMSQEEMQLVTTTNVDFEVADPLHDRVVNQFDWEESNGARTLLWLSATEIALRLGIEHPSAGEVSRIGRIVAKLNCKQRKKSPCGKKRLLAVPVREDGELGFQ